MAAQRKRKLSFLPQPPAADPAIGYGSFPVEIGVGELLRMTRERQGQELQSVANQLRIRLAYLQAIEDGRFRDLPGSTYAVGFVRSYADYLGLDGGDVVRRFREEAARVHGRPKLVFPAVSAEGKIPGAAVLLLSAVGAAIVYGAWYYMSSSEDRDLQLIAEVPDRLVALPPGETSPGEPVTVPAPTEGEAPGGSATTTPPATGPVPHGSASTAQASEALAVSPPSDDGPINPEPEASAPASPPVAESPAGAAPPATAEAPPPAEQPQAARAPVPCGRANAAPSAPAAGSPPAADATESIPASPSIPVAPPAPADTAAAPQQEAALPPADEKGIVLEARLDSWIQIVDGKGQTVIDRILRAGERYVVPAGTGLVLTTGNAGGLDVFVDGQRTPPLGDVGAVKRKISLDSGQLRQGNTTE
jgi:cytoskeletal protein RodZ